MILNLDHSQVKFTSPNKTTYKDKGSDSVTISMSMVTAKLQPHSVLVYIGNFYLCNLYWIISIVIFPFIEKKRKKLNLQKRNSTPIF